MGGVLFPSKWLFTFLLGVSAQTIYQNPRTRMQRVGSPLSLECTVKGTSNPNLYWYQQTVGRALRLLFYSISVNSIESEAPKHLTASRPQDGQFFLTSEKLLQNDSGIYFCAWSLTLSRVRQTSVQKLHSLLTSPSLSRNLHSGAGWLEDVYWIRTVSQCKSNRSEPERTSLSFPRKNRRDLVLQSLSWVNVIKNQCTDNHHTVSSKFQVFLA